MTILAEIAVASEDFVLGEILSDERTDTRVELARFVPIDADAESALSFWVIDSKDPDEYERRVRADPRVERLVNGDAGGDRMLYRVEWVDRPAFLTALRENNIVTETAEGGTSEWVFGLRADTQHALSGFQDDCFEASLRLDVRRVVDDTVPIGTSIDGMSGEQPMALESTSSAERVSASKPVLPTRTASHFRNYCEECAWSASTETHSRNQIYITSSGRLCALGSRSPKARSVVMISIELDCSPGWRFSSCI